MLDYFQNLLIRYFRIFRDAIPYGIFMFVYEYLIEKMRSQSLQRNYHYKEEKVEAWRTAVAGACAGMISWLPGIPFDVIKTKMMTENDPKRYKSVYHCYKVITKVRPVVWMKSNVLSWLMRIFRLIAGIWLPIFIPRWYSFSVTIGTSQRCLIHGLRTCAQTLPESRKHFVMNKLNLVQINVVQLFSLPSRYLIYGFISVTKKICILISSCLFMQQQRKSVNIWMLIYL